MAVQPKKELEDFYATNDPWGYETNKHDVARKAILFAELVKFLKPKIFQVKNRIQ